MLFIINVLIILCIAWPIGHQRAKVGKELGFRSLALVMLGAFMFTYISLSNGIIADYHVIAQIVTGISFVGAGLIFKDGSVHNLTTAILVWTMAAVAVAIGLGFYKECIVISLAIYYLLSSKDN